MVRNRSYFQSNTSELYLLYLTIKPSDFSLASTCSRRYPGPSTRLITAIRWPCYRATNARTWREEGKVSSRPTDIIPSINFVYFSYHAPFRFGTLDETKHQLPDAVQVGEQEDEPSDSLWRVGVRRRRRESLSAALGRWKVCVTLVYLHVFIIFI